MSVNILLCEGAPKSPDVRVLTALLSGVCLVEPSGDKYGLPRWVRTNRGVRIASVIAALRDRDLEAEYSQPQDSPHPWRQNDERGHPFWLGWYWERVEIENYLVDPQVVQRSLGDRAPDQQSYQDGLRAAAESIADYSAARTALTQSRHRPRTLDNRWGQAGGYANHPIPGNRTEVICRKEISAILEAHRSSQHLDETEVKQRFEAFLPACRPGGDRFASFLIFFSGKDLLCAMRESLRSLGYPSPGSFVERILVGLERSTDNPWDWLPEWGELRRQAASITSNTGS